MTGGSSDSTWRGSPASIPLPASLPAPRLPQRCHSIPSSHTFQSRPRVKTHAATGPAHPQRKQVDEARIVRGAWFRRPSGQAKGAALQRTEGQHATTPPPQGGLQTQKQEQKQEQEQEQEQGDGQRPSWYAV